MSNNLYRIIHENICGDGYNAKERSELIYKECFKYHLNNYTRECIPSLLNIFEIECDEDGYPVIPIDDISELYKHIESNMPEISHFCILPHSINVKTFNSEQVQLLIDNLNDLLRNMKEYEKSHINYAN